MAGAVQANATGPTAKPVLLCLSEGDRLRDWCRGLSALNAFVLVEARNPQTAAELVRACRPDLLLVGEDFGAQGRKGPSSSLPPAGLPLVAVEMDDDSVAPGHPWAEDVLPPGLSFETVAIRLRAVLRRERPTALTFRVTWEGLELRHDERRVLVGTRAVALSLQEFNLLAVMLEDPAKVWSRDELIGLLWGNRGRVGVSALNVMVQKLRRHLLPHLGRDCVAAIRGAGYRLTCRS